MRIKKGYKVRNIGGENIIVSIGTMDINLTKVISLNETSLWLWEQLGNEEFDTARVASLLTERYDVDEKTAANDSQRWIDSLRKAGLIEE